VNRLDPNRINSNIRIRSVSIESNSQSPRFNQLSNRSNRSNKTRFEDRSVSPKRKIDKLLDDLNIKQDESKSKNKNTREFTKENLELEKMYYKKRRKDRNK